MFIARSKDDDMLLTKNMVVGESVYGEKRINVDVSVVCHVRRADLIVVFISGRQSGQDRIPRLESVSFQTRCGYSQWCR